MDADVADPEKVVCQNLVMLSAAAIKTKKLLTLSFEPEKNLEDFVLVVKSDAIGSKFYFPEDLLRNPECIHLRQPDQVVDPFTTICVNSFQCR
jgi:hypothetical protein